MTAKSIPSLAAYIGVLMATCALPSVAFAAEEPAARSAETEVDGVQVVGRREEASVAAIEAVEYGNAVQVVTAQQIEAGGFANFAETAAALIRGANIGYSPDEGEYTIRRDGGGDRDTLVVLDGVPLYDRGPALEEIWSSTTIDPHMVERMEIFRGGNSLFYGSNGGIGVISLVTKTPDGSTKGDFGISYGAFNSRELWGNYSFPLDDEGRHSLMFYGSSHQTNGPRIYAPESYVDNVANAGGVQEFPLNRNNVGVKYLWKIDDTSELRANAQYTQIEFQDAFPDSNVFTPNTVKYPIFDAAYTKRWSDRLTTEVSAYFSNPQLFNTELYPEICLVKTGCVDSNNPTKPLIAYGAFTGAVEPFVNQGFGQGNQYKSGFIEYGASIRNTLKFGEALEIVAGVQTVSYQNDSDVVFKIKDDVNTVNGVFLDVRPRLPFSPDTAISLAVRTDFSEAFDSKTIWKFGVRQPLPAGFYARANGGTSYSLPRTNELFANTATFVGNPNLEPEETESYSLGLGLDRSFGERRVQAEIGMFHTDISKRIQGTSGLTPNTRYNNSAVTEIRGLTADLDLEITPEWKLSLSYTKQDAHLANTPDIQINETPEWMVQGGLTYASESNRFHMSIMPRMQGPEWATGGLRSSLRKNFGEYLVVNLTLGYWAGENQQHRFQVRVVNLFDEDYAERYGFGNMRYSQAFNSGQIKATDPAYYYGYAFEGKPRAVYFSYSTKF
jgi:iron complex outermembrane receptor protein